VLVIGCGKMGSSHARAYRAIDGFELVGLVAPSARRRDALAAELGGVPVYQDAKRAIRELRPQAVSVNSYPDTHASYALTALENGAHVFCEKPLATTVADARTLAATARELDRKVVVGYILRHHPSWVRFVEIARTMGKPLVMRMNLNQQSSAAGWETHKQLMRSMSPIVDCGVHYVDVMCQMTGAPPVRCSAIGARLTDEIASSMYNYGQLQVAFADGSVGWYEAGWGPMMSETAYFVKDVVGPNGSVSIVPAGSSGSNDVESHTKADRLLVHRGELGPDGTLADRDEHEDMPDEPDHQELCTREQRFFLRAIREDIDLSQHLEDAVRSLQIVLAADESVRTGRTVDL
jgi:predicted dehydrogenase